MKKLYYIFLSMFILLLTSCTSTSESEGVQVVVTTNPNYNLVKYIAQDKVDVYYLSSNNSHNIEFKTEDIKKIQDADIVFYNGLGLDDKVLETSNNKEKFIRTTEGVETIEVGEDDHDHDHEDSHSHDHGIYDPHVWLSLKEYKIMGKNVLDTLINIDSENKEFYTNNYNDFVSRADSIYNTYIDEFKSLVNKEFISNHASYGYLSRDFSLINSSIYDINNHGEVNPQNLQNIIDIVNTKNIKLIVGDENESNKELETISRETGITYKLVNNLEITGDYFTEYEKLLSSIYDGLR